MSRYESLIEQQIRLAQERGEFDNLPGSGRPAPGAGPSSAPETPPLTSDSWTAACPVST
jgi:hypothetical protein